MSPSSDQRAISIISACMLNDGSPTFALTEIAVTQEEAENGVQYYLVEAELMQRGYEEPFVHFPEDESPDFLHAAVREFLGLSSGIPEPTIHFFAEEQACPVSSK